MAVRSNGLFTALPSAGWQHAKGGCYVYGSSGEGVDFGTIIEGEGTLFLSKGAIVEAAGVLGLVYAEDALKLEEENAYLSHEIARLKQCLLEVEDILTASAQAAARAVADRR